MRFSDANIMQISDIARELSISSRTIRLYEQMGLAPHPKRTEGNVRYYEKGDIVRFKFILKLKTLGITLEEMADLARQYDEELKIPEKLMPRVIELLNSHLNRIGQKISALQSLENGIRHYLQKHATTE